MPNEMPKYEWAQNCFPVNQREYQLLPPPGDGWTLSAEHLSADGSALVCIWCRVKL